MSDSTIEPSSKFLLYTLRFIAAAQLLLGAAFLFAPQATAAALTLPVAPAWTDWLFGQMAARFIGYGVGLLAAARAPRRHHLWITTMIGIQAIDWAVTLLHLVQEDVTLRQVTTAAIFPLLFIAILWQNRAQWQERGTT